MRDYRIYIISPLSANNEKEIKVNMEKAIHYKKYISEVFLTLNNHLNFRCFAPHSYLPNELDDNSLVEREIAINFGLKLLGICDAVAVIQHLGLVSEGMRQEIITAITQNKVVFVNNSVMGNAVKEIAEDMGYSIDIHYIYDTDFIRGLR